MVAADSAASTVKSAALWGMGAVVSWRQDSTNVPPVGASASTVTTCTSGLPWAQEPITTPSTTLSQLELRVAAAGASSVSEYMYVGGTPRTGDKPPEPDSPKLAPPVPVYGVTAHDTSTTGALGSPYTFTLWAVNAVSQFEGCTASNTTVHTKPNRVASALDRVTVTSSMAGRASMSASTAAAEAFTGIHAVVAVLTVIVQKPEM
jgi:hypothetical protein